MGKVGEVWKLIAVPHTFGCFGSRSMPEVACATASRHMHRPMSAAARFCAREGKRSGMERIRRKERKRRVKLMWK